MLRAAVLLAVVASSWPFQEPAPEPNVTGTVKLPPAPRLRKSRNPRPEEQYLQGPAIVFIDKVPGEFKPGDKNPEMGQKKCQFAPLALPILVGTTVAFTNGDERPAELIGREAASDIAVLKVEAEGLATVELGDSDEVQVGDEVVAIGNALALDGGLSITRGIVSGLHRTVSTNTGATLFGMLQTDAAINPGNSGGPLVDAAGRVVAINTAIANPQASNNVGFAIPIANAKPIIDDLRLGRPGAFLGVGTVTVTPAIARQQDLGVTAGALVTRVTPGSAADEAGIREGDVIVSIAGQPVAETSDVQILVRRQRPGDAVEVVVNRAGETRTLRATLTERPAA